MFEQDDEVLNRVVDELRSPVRVNPALDARVMAAIEAERHEGALMRARRWWTEPKSFSVTPLRALAMAAGIVIVAVLAGERTPSTGGAPAERVATAPAEPERRDTVVQFVFVAPNASSVSLVGDFNGWDRARTPLEMVASSGMWSVALPLSPGRHRYAFIVDGTRWVADPGAPRALGDDFGSPNSVVTVGDKTT